MLLYQSLNRCWFFLPLFLRSSLFRVIKFCSSLTGPQFCLFKCSSFQDLTQSFFNPLSAVNNWELKHLILLMLHLLYDLQQMTRVLFDIICMTLIVFCVLCSYLTWLTTLIALWGLDQISVPITQCVMHSWRSLRFYGGRRLNFNLQNEMLLFGENRLDEWLSSLRTLK